MIQPDFIEVYDGLLSPVVCRDLIERFERSLAAGRSPTSSDTDSSSDGSELPLDSQPGWSDARQALNDAALRGFRHYLRRYGHAALGPLRFEVQDPITSAPVTLNARGIAALGDESLNSLILQLFRPGGVYVRRHRGDAGGEPGWRHELYPNPSLDDAESLHRVLLWSVYLNDGFHEGETEFLYQARTITPKTGSLVIAPTAFTHTYRQKTPKGGDRYVASGWILFRRADTFFDASASSVQR